MAWWLEREPERHQQSDHDRTGLEDPRQAEQARIRRPYEPIEQYRRDDEAGQGVAEKPLLEARPEGPAQPAGSRRARERAEQWYEYHREAKVQAQLAHRVEAEWIGQESLQQDCR